MDETTLAAICREVKRTNRPAAKMFSKIGWHPFRMLTLLLHNWLTGTEAGGTILALPEVNHDVVQAIGHLYTLKMAGVVEFIGGEDGETTTFHVQPTGPTDLF